MSEDKVYHHPIEMLRDPKRLAFLETDKVVQYCLEGITPLTMLDVGTGSGIFAEAFFRRGLEVTGVDIQEPMLEVARTYVPEASFQLASSEKLPFEEKAFDLVFLGLLLHESEQPQKTLEESARVCILRTAVLEWPYEEGRYGPPIQHRLEPEEIKEMATSSGFSRFKVIPMRFLSLYLLDN